MLSLSFTPYAPRASYSPPLPLKFPEPPHSFLVARTKSKLLSLQADLIDALIKTHHIPRSEAESRVLVRVGDISSAQDLVEVREDVVRGQLAQLFFLARGSIRSGPDWATGLILMLILVDLGWSVISLGEIRYPAYNLRSSRHSDDLPIYWVVHDPSL